MSLSGNKIIKLAIVQSNESGTGGRYRRYAPSNTTQGPPKPKPGVSKIMRLMTEGDSKIVLKDEYKSAIIVLGNSEALKSIFVQWTAEKDDQLLSEEQGEDTDEYIIKPESGNNMINLESEAIFPELIIDTKNNTAYYDCPGFGDTIVEADSVAMNFVLRKLAGHLTEIKLVFVVDHPSVKNVAVTSERFLTMLTQATELVRDFFKFDKSIALVVTDVVPPYEKKKKRLASDESVKAKIAKYLRKTKESLVERTGNSSITEKEMSSAQRSMNLIDIFLIQDEADYVRIGLFKRPDESGSLDKIDTMLERKESIHQMLYETLQYTIVRGEDFGAVNPNNTDSGMTAAADGIDKKIWSILGEMVERIKNHYRLSLGYAWRQYSWYSASSKNVTVRPNTPGLLANLASAKDVTASLVISVKGVTLNSLADQLVRGYRPLRIPAIAGDLAHIEGQGKFFNFLQTLDDNKFAIRPWEDLLKPLETYLNDLHNKTDDKVQSIAREAHSNITVNLADLDKEIMKSCDDKIRFISLKKLPAHYLEGRSMIQEIDATMGSQVNVDELAEKVKSVSAKFIAKSDASRIISGNILRFGKRLQFLDILSASNKYNQAEEWKSPFKGLVKYLEESATWYKFLGDLSKKLYSYEEQKNKTAYGGDSVTKDSFKDFLSDINKLNVEESGAVANMEITDIRLQEVNELLNSTMKSTVNLSCESGTLLAQGDVVMFSDFIDEKGAIKDCDEPKQVNIFALTKLFIDRNLEAMGKKLLVAAMAPKWETVGARHIDLKGLTFDRPQPAAKGGPGLPGAAGEPGKPGGHGGSFLGLAERLAKNGWGKLTINTAGGDARPGQKGGDGGDGINGESLTTDPKKWVDSYGVRSCHYRYSNYEEQFMSFGAWFDCKDSPPAEYVSCSITVRGKRGQNGGSGGPGGAGAPGGLPGNATLLVLDGEPRAEIFNNTGSPGIPGRGGRGGSGGLTGKTVLASCRGPTKYKNGAYVTTNERDKWTYRKSQSNNTRAMTGKLGQKGAEGSDPEPPVTFDRPARIINQYKRYLAKNLGFRLKQYPLTRFLDLLSNDETLRKAYTTLDFIDEIKLLDELSQVANATKESLIPKYESLLDRIAEYAENPKPEEKSAEYKKGLTFSYTTILTKLHLMRDYVEYAMIIDIEQYLDKLGDIIKKLADTSFFGSMYYATENVRSDYMSELEKKITETNAFIMYQLKPDLASINKDMDGMMDDIIGDIREAIESEEKDKEILIKENKKKFEKQLITQTTIHFIVSATDVVGCLASMSTSALTIIGRAPLVNDALMLQSVNSLGIHERRMNLQTLGHLVRLKRKKDVARLQKRLDEISDELSNEPDLGDVLDKVEQLRQKSENLIDMKGNVKDTDESVESLETQVMEAISAMKKQLGEDGDKKTIEVLEKCGKIINYAQAVFDIYDKNRRDSETVEQITDTLDAVNDNIKSLDEYEDDLFSSITPEIEKLNKLMDKIEAGSASELQRIDVKKWDVQVMLQDIREAITQATEDNDMQYDLAICVDNLLEMVTTLTNIYNRLQDFQWQKKLAEYLNQANYPYHISVKNLELEKTFPEMEMEMRSNLILEQYHTGISRVKQWTFPFAHDYLEYSNAMVPSELDIERDDVKGLARKALEQISLIKEKVKKYKTSFRDSDEFISHAVFNGTGPETSAFYVWKGSENKNIISRLLSGEVVSLKANVTSSPAHKNAIKFNSIELNFRSANQTLLTELNKKLKSFAVTAIHMGNSYYRNKDKFYVVLSGSQEINWYFAKRPDGLSNYINPGYDKIRKGEMMLSPYALWKLKLTKVGSSYSYPSDFDQLRSYSDGFDLELAGNGSYVGESANIPDFKEGEYYELDNKAYPPPMNVSTNGTKKTRHRRSVALPVVSSAARPSSLLNAVISFGKRLIGRLGSSYDDQVPRSVDQLVDSKTFVASATIGIGQSSSTPGSTAQEMGQVLFNNTDVNGLLTWATLLARKWSGFRPKGTRTASYDAAVDVELAITSHELVDRFISRVEQLARSRGASDAIDHQKLYADCLSVVRGKLMRGEDATVAASLVQLARKAMLQFDTDDLHQLLSSVTEDVDELSDEYLQRNVSHSVPCLSEQCADITSLVESDSLSRGVSDFNSLHQAFHLWRLS